MTVLDSAAPSLSAGRVDRSLSCTRSRSAVIRRVGVFSAILLLAAGLRTWGIGAAFESSDQAVMPYLVRHSYGVGWLFGHEYGPVAPVVHRTWAEILSRLDLPMGEAAHRLPILVIGLAQVALVFPLLRRLRCSTREAMAGMLCCAVLPTLVTDVRLSWAWGYLSIWLFTGTVALWATLAFIDDRRRWQLLVAATALLAHCLSNTYAFALPATLIVVWAGTWTALRRAGLDLFSPPVNRPAVVGVVLPCLAALIVIGLCWQGTGRGQIGHLLMKHHSGTTGLHLDQIARLPGMGVKLFGGLFSVIAGLGLLSGPFVVGGRRRLLAVWAWLGLLPVLLLADWDRIGYPQAYLIEVALTGGLLGTMVVGVIYRRVSGRGWARAAVGVAAGLAFAQMTAAAVKDDLAGGRLGQVARAASGGGETRTDSGIKAAGWYVRRHVPPDAIVMSLHTNKGMELPVAEFYLGRKILAGYDHRPEMLQPLLQAMRDDVDVMIVEARHRTWVENLTNLQCVCTLRNQTRAVRCVYARPDLALPRMDEEVSALNDRYDRQYRPRHVPIPLPAAADYAPRLAKYQKMEKELKNRGPHPESSANGRL